MLFHGLLDGTLADPSFDESWVQFEALFAVLLGTVEVHQLHVRPCSVWIKLREYILITVNNSQSQKVLPFRCQECVWYPHCSVWRHRERHPFWSTHYQLGAPPRPFLHSSMLCAHSRVLFSQSNNQDVTPLIEFQSSYLVNFFQDFFVAMFR